MTGATSLATDGAGALGSDDPKNQELYLHASPSAIGTLSYIAYETRRIFDEVKPAGESFRALEVTALVHPVDATNLSGNPELLGHCSGQVFDIAIGKLPPAELDCLRFVLDDLGWYGYLGFTEESPGSDSMHIGCSPSSRDFFAQVFQEALAGMALAQSGVAK